MKKISVALLSFTVFAAGIDFPPHTNRAWAVIGRPLTPLSYAGVARRTTRRTVYAGAAVAGTAAVAAASIATLPAGCVNAYSGGLTYHNCSGTYYQESFNGPDVV